MTMSTIKVPVELHDRINAEAHRHSMTAAGFIETLLDSYVRQALMEEFGKAMRSTDHEYWDEFNEWSANLTASERNSCSENSLVV